MKSTIHVSPENAKEVIMKLQRSLVLLLLMITPLTFQPAQSLSQELPVYLRDRGTGMPMSQFGTYIREGQVLVYPFYEYYYDGNLEYEPFDFGLVSKQEFRGRYEANEGILFIGYGISRRLAVEFEAGIISAQLDKSSRDTSPLPSRIEKSGLSDVEGQIRWRWNFENASTPEFFNYFETVFPTGEENSLIGTAHWEFKLGTGLIKGFRWGTVTVRAAVDYDDGEQVFGLGEYALEYLKRVSDHFRFFAMMEGSEDEIAVVPELQWHVNRNIFFKANAGFGVTSKATDFAPEVGVMFSLN
jgi:hypothetical protein